MRRLLRMPRYFDPEGENEEYCFNCGGTGHKSRDCPFVRPNHTRTFSQPVYSFAHAFSHERTRYAYTGARIEVVFSMKLTFMLSTACVCVFVSVSVCADVYGRIPDASSSDVATERATVLRLWEIWPSCPVVPQRAVLEMLPTGTSGAAMPVRQ